MEHPAQIAIDDMSIMCFKLSSLKDIWQASLQVSK